MRGLRGALFATVVAGCLLFGTPPVRADENSVNWSGYAIPAAPGTSISAISGSWVVPAINPAPPAFSSSWIGIGGYATADVIQVGTASSGRLGGDHAWYEMLPGGERPLTDCAGDRDCTVRQGDRMVGAVTNTGGDAWRLALADYGQGATARWTWAKTVSYVSSRSSAELIFEAPMIGRNGVGVYTVPANAPHARFLAGATVVINGTPRAFTSAAPRRIIMIAPGVTAVRTATPSPLAPDGHFQVCAYKRTCPNF